MSNGRLGFAGALVLFFGFSAFAWWDFNRPRETDERSSGPSLSQLLTGDASSSRGPRHSFESEAAMKEFQNAHVDDFKKNIGRRRGNTTLVDVSYYSRGSTMLSEGNSNIESPQDGWYYVTKTDYCLPCGKSGTTTGFEFCGSSSAWDSD